MTERCGATHAFTPPPEAYLSLEVIECARPHGHAGEHYTRWGGRFGGCEWMVEVRWYAIH